VENQGLGILIYGDKTHNDHYLTRVFVQCRDISVPCDVGIRIANSQGFWINQCGVYHCKVGLNLLSQNGLTLEHGFLSDNAYDSCSNAGVVINSGKNGTVRRIQSIGDWSSSNNGHGILVDAADGNIDDLKFIGTRAYGNGGDGFFISNLELISIDNATISGNGRNQFSSGITIDKTCGTFILRNSLIGASSGYPNTQLYGITGIDNAQQSLVNGNIFKPNVKGAFAGSLDLNILSRNVEFD
jgi:hypothetical protein